MWKVTKQSSTTLLRCLMRERSIDQPTATTIAELIARLPSMGVGAKFVGRSAGRTTLAKFL
jgi:hypothetical protein